jgi:uncharacterized delta-60 repeat protein
MTSRTRSGRLTLTLVLVASVLWATPAEGAPGDLDRTFRNDGTVITNLTPWNENVGDVAIQANGKIVVVGRVSSLGGYGAFAVVRYLPDGRLDDRFGRDGVVTTNIARREDAASAVAIQSDGTIVVAGTATVAGRDAIVVARYRRAGGLDRSFGDAGTVIVDVAAGDGNEVANDVAIQTDGKIVIAGTTLDAHDFALARLDPGGTLDPTFHGDGTVTTGFGGALAAASAAAIQSDGKIVVAGQSWTLAGFDGIHVVRYGSDGQVDQGFGINGVASAEFTEGTDGGGDSAGAVTIQPDGAIVVAGDAGGAAEYTSRFGLARFDEHGSLDPSFRGDGTAVTNFTRWDDSASDLVIQADGMIVAVGVAGFGWGRQATFALARYDTDGLLDGSFGDDGKLRTRVGGVQPGQQVEIVGSRATAVALQTDGRIVVVGEIDGVVADRIDGRFAVARYRAE